VLKFQFSTTRIYHTTSTRLKHQSTSADSQVLANIIGCLPGLDKIPISVSKDVKRNIRSFNDVNLHYEINWDPKKKSLFIANDEETFNFQNSHNVFARNFNIALQQSNKTNPCLQTKKSRKLNWQGKLKRDCPMNNQTL
jgi:hypothetical protein